MNDLHVSLLMTKKKENPFHAYVFACIKIFIFFFVDLGQATLSPVIPFLFYCSRRCSYLGLFFQDFPAAMNI